MVGFRLSNVNPRDARKESEKKDPKKIYFIFAEGEKTENIYFNELSSHVRKKANIEIRVMNRWNVNKGHSNQYRVIKDVEKYLKQIKDLDIDKTAELSNIASKFENHLLTVSDLFQLSNILTELEQKHLIHGTEEVHGQIKTVLTMADFSVDFDQICIVMDRDMQSFKQFQYDEVLKIAENNN